MAAPDPSPDELLARTAALARLSLAPGAEHELAGQFTRILEAFRSLTELAIEGVEPMTSPIETSDVVRADRAHDAGLRERLLDNAPEREGDFFGVPKTVGGES